MQRLRVNFSRAAGLRFISHLDLIRLWHRALNRADIAIAYSEGFNPHPRLSLAAPLALGVTSDAELMDVILAKFVSPHTFTDSVSRQLPEGIDIRQVYNAALNMPSMQSQVRFAEYTVELTTDKTWSEIEAAIADLLRKKSLPWQHQRDTGPRKYDLRILIEDIDLIDWQSGKCTIGMKLRCDSRGSGRPEQVAAALGFKNYPESIHRTRLIFETK